jgi:uncharacterized protein
MITEPASTTNDEDDHGFEILDRAESLELLRTVQVGRLAWATPDGRVHVRPITYGLVGEDVIIRTRTGSILAAARANLPVTLEADCFEPGLKAGWSVLVVGAIEDLGFTAEAAGLRESVQPWARGKRPHVLRIRHSEVTGRRLHPSRSEIVIVQLDDDSE